VSLDASAPQLTKKWRPSLALVIFVVLGAVLALPLISLFFFRLYETQIIRQTEGELIGQAKVIAEVFRREVMLAQMIVGQASPSPPSLKEAALSERLSEPNTPIMPMLDLTGSSLLPRRPDAMPALVPASPAMRAIGVKLEPMLFDVQRVTLAGFRLLDANGVVIAGSERSDRDDIGRSLAHVSEVGEAMQGRFSSVLRQRVSTSESPPLYSISRGTMIRVFLAMPVMVDGKVGGVVYAVRTPSNIVKHLYEERQKVASALAMVLLLAFAIGLVFFRTVSNPMRQLIKRTELIAKGDRSAIAPLDHHGTREFAQLSQSFLDMASALNNRSDYIANFANHVSHELKSPLTSIQGSAELLRDDLDGGAGQMSEESRRRFLDNILGDASRLTALLSRLRDLARADSSPTLGETTMAAVLPELRSAFPQLDIAAEGSLEGSIALSSENLQIILSHLADNAARHGASKLSISALAGEGKMTIAVGDNGSGVSPGNREKIFDAFFTTRREQGGTGMGLGIVRSLLATHQGTIALGESEGGAHFIIEVPLAS
jgi:signal transduction histidine kinase